MIIKNNSRAAATIISNRFIDEYMAEANGEFLKVYLYLLRLSQDSGKEITIAGIAEHLDQTEKAVQRALRYWEKKQWMSLEVDSKRRLNAVELKDPTCEAEQNEAGESEMTEKPAEESVEKAESLTEKAASGAEVSSEDTAGKKAAAAPVSAAVPEKRPLTPEMMAHLQTDEEFSQITVMAEMYLGRTLTATDLQMFAYLYEDLHFSEDLLEFLVGYCVDSGHAHLRYIEAVALNWHKEGLMTVEKAREAVKAYTKENKAVMTAFGITGRSLNKEERGYVSKWFNDYRMPVEVIVEACQITMAATQKGSFSYADKILSDWNAADVRTLEAVKSYRSARKSSSKSKQGQGKAQTQAPKTEDGNRFRNYQQRNIDYDALLSQGGMNPYGDDNQ